MNKLSKFESYSRGLTWFMALLLSALVAGCGFGGGNSDYQVPPPTTTISGIAASGAPIVGGTVQMVCAGGTPGTAVRTGADGSFTVTAPKTAPCVIKVSGATGAIGGPLFSVIASSSQTRANVNQLTNMLAYLLAGGDPDTGLFQSPGSISGKVTTAAVATYKAMINASVIANLGAAAGIPTSFDFLEGTFTANHAGFDQVLDKIGFAAAGNTVSIVFNGAPLLAVNATTGAANTTSSAVISAATLATASTFGAPVTAKAVTALSFAGLPAVAATIDDATKTIAVTVPSGTNVKTLIPTFAITGGSVKVGTTVQTSGVTANDFTNPVAFTVTAADGTTSTYTVSVAVASNTAKTITALSFAGLTGAAGIVDEAAKTIAVTVPYGTNVKALVPTFLTTAASVKVGTTVQTSSTTANDFTSPVTYTVAAADGTTSTYTVTVTVSPISAKASTAFSFAGIPGAAGTINEAAKTIAVTVPFGTDVTALAATFKTTGTGVKVGTTVQTSSVTANNFTSPVAYVVTAGDGTTATYTATVTVAPNTAKALTAYSIAGFPAVAGTINEAAKTVAVTMPFGTDLTSLNATFTTTGASVKVGTTVQTSTVTANNFTAPVAYIVTASDGTTATYTVTVTLAANTAKAMTAYSFAGFTGSTGVINEAENTIAVTVPNGTSVTALAATFTTTGVNVKVGTAVQTSTATANNFTAPVVYIVTAADGTTATYTVTVTVAPSAAKAMTAYSFAGFTGAAGTINEAAKTIAVTVPNGTDVTTLVATFTTTGASVKVGTAVQTSTATANNFAAPVAYVVTAADASTATYTVTVTVAPSAAKAMTAYSFAGFTGAAGTINETAKTIAVTVPNGTPLTALVATFTSTGTGVKVGTAVQTSTATANDFTAPVAYIVTASDGNTATYTVTVSVAASSAKATTAFSFAGFSDSVGVINETASPKTIAVSVPPGTNLTALVAAFTTTGAGVKVGTAVQTSNATPNDFTTSPVAYVVSAADGTTATYNVTVTLGLGPAPVLLGTAGNFVILTKAGITDVPSSAITGNIGTSPISGSFIGVTCAEMATGQIYEVDAAYVGNGVVTCARPGTTGGTPNADKTFVDTAVGDMAIAYTDAAGRAAGVGPNLNIGAGTVATQTLVAGTYTWGSNMTITGDLTLNGGANDVWIFQVTGTLDLSPGVKILLTGGALAKNVFWQATGAVTLGTTSQFQGIILAKTNIALNTGASINGRLFAQTAATLQSNAVTQP